MKKTYIAPAAKVYKVNTTQMIADSVKMTTDAADKDYSGGGDVKGFTSPSNVWDTEW